MLFRSNTILKKSLLPVLSEHLDFVRSLGVEKIFVMPLERTFGSSWPNDPYYEREKLEPSEEARKAFRELHEIKKKSSFLTNTEEDIQLIEDTVFGNLKLDRFVCQAAERNIVVDMLGNVRLCHYMELLVGPGKSLGNIRVDSLPEICGEKADPLRELMRVCNHSCKLLTCNRKTVF